MVPDCASNSLDYLTIEVMLKDLSSADLLDLLQSQVKQKERADTITELSEWAGGQRLWCSDFLTSSGDFASNASASKAECLWCSDFRPSSGDFASNASASKAEKRSRGSVFVLLFNCFALNRPGPNDARHRAQENPSVPPFFEENPRSLQVLQFSVTRDLSFCHFAN